MEELQPEELEELVQELQGESGEAEELSPEVEELLRDLQQSRSWMTRFKAAERLGELGESSPCIVQSLIATGESDSFLGVREAAVASLHAPVHQEILQGNPDLMQRAQLATRHVETAQEEKQRAVDEGSRTAPGDHEAGLKGFPIKKPSRFRVVTQGDTLIVTWRDAALHKAVSAVLMILLLLAFGRSLYAGGFSGSDTLMLALLLLSGYWVLVAFANSTRITASREEWMVQMGPFPFPIHRLYRLHKMRLDPATLREIWSARVEEKRQLGNGRGAGSNLWFLQLLVLGERLLEGLGSTPGGTYTLYARGTGGTDRLLLTGLEDQEAAYLKHMLQDLLEARDGLPVRQ